jgi:hypothetical protein
VDDVVSAILASVSPNIKTMENSQYIICSDDNDTSYYDVVWYVILDALT